ncbi:MAG: lysophospholipid acyltransferase family protein [bacterium]
MSSEEREQPGARVVWLARLGSWLVRGLGWTWRIRVSHDDALNEMRHAKKPFIFSLWHGQLLPLLYHHRRQNVAILISEHADGEIIARIAMSLGYRTVRGSTSRGAARALLGLARVINEGADLAITPDGPRGPAKSFAPGALVIAHRAKVPIIAVAATASSAWRLGTWDRFLIPRPFARVEIAYSDAVYVEASDARQAVEHVDRARDAMSLAERRAEERTEPRGARGARGPDV